MVQRALFRPANQQVLKSLSWRVPGSPGSEADFRKLWITRINALPPGNWDCPGASSAG